ncbi:MAG: hypothetical protein ACRDT6_15545, partial [Micromonosporaceae bacterium]
ASVLRSATFTLTVQDDTPPPSNGIANGGFETGNLNGWTTTGTATVTSPGRSGSYAAKLGGTRGTSSLSQTFTVPAGKSRVQLYFQGGNCSFGDTTTVTLVNNTTGFRQNLIQQGCFNTSFWWQASSGVTAGGNYTVIVTQANTNGSSLVRVDDVALT